MVGKLLKHDLISLFRLLLYLSCFALGFAVLSRILVATSDGFLPAFFMMLSLYASFALIFVAFFGSVSRFYKSLFTGEGYMTFSLPVSVTKLLISKLLAALIATLVGFLVFIVCFFITMSGLPGETFEELINLLGDMFRSLGSVLSYDPLITVELILLLIALIPMSLLQYYLCLSLGQIFSKHRVGWAFGFIILSSIVLTVLGTTVLVPIFNAASYVSPHLSVWLLIIVFVGLDVGYFFLIRYILSHKLNLLV